jgi:hypothetical protein
MSDRPDSHQDVPKVATELGESTDGRVGIFGHLYTSVYINENEVERRLGTNMEVYSRSIALTYSQIDLVYTSSNPQLSGANGAVSQ